MNKLFFLFFVAFLPFVSTVVYSQASWKLIGKEGELQSGTAVKLFTVKNKMYLRYKERKFGINLGWWGESEGASNNANITFVKQGGGVIKCGDKVALKVANGSYLKYEKRTWGINIVWTKNPVYEWELRNTGNKQGDPIFVNGAVNGKEQIGLLNMKAKDFVRNCTRSGSPVVDLAWVKDCPNGWRVPGRANDAVKSLTKSDIEKAIKYGTVLISLL